MAAQRSRIAYVLLGMLLTGVFIVLLNTATAQQEPESVGRFQLVPTTFLYRHYQSGIDTVSSVVRLDTQTGAMLWIKDPARNYDGSVHFEAYDVLVRMNPLTGLERANREKVQNR